MSNVKHLGISIQDAISTDQLKVAYNKKISERQMYENENKFSRSTGRALQQYYIEIKNYYTTFKISSDCNEITFINIGINAVNISGVPLQQNQSLRISGSIGEIDTTQYDLSFAIPISTNNNLIVIRKLYK
jgi:hypothetical protein